MTVKEPLTYVRGSETLRSAFGGDCRRVEAHSVHIATLTLFAFGHATQREVWDVELRPLADIRDSV